MITRWLRYILGSVLVLGISTTLAYIALGVLPGDAIQTQFTLSGADSDFIEQRRAALGLNDPLVIQYFRYMLNLLRGDLGNSLLSGEPVIEALARNIPPTFTLAASALFISMIIGLILGAATIGNSRRTRAAAQLVISLSLSTPSYWTGTLAIYGFTVFQTAFSAVPGETIMYFILPVLVLAFHSAGNIARITASSLQSVQVSGHVLVAQAKGLPESIIFRQHILRVALSPILSIIALQSGFLFSGTMITESLFVRPGIGRLLLEGVVQQDYPVVLGCVILSASVYVTFATLADIIISIIDPRISV
jgi:ABC-type dipeptide/oligopeptide/nickel transport system permease component